MIFFCAVHLLRIFIRFKGFSLIFIIKSRLRNIYHFIFKVNFELCHFNYFYNQSWKQCLTSSWGVLPLINRNYYQWKFLWYLYFIENGSFSSRLQIEFYVSTLFYGGRCQMEDEKFNLVLLKSLLLAWGFISCELLFSLRTSQHQQN